MKVSPEAGTLTSFRHNTPKLIASQVADSLVNTCTPSWAEPKFRRFIHWLSPSHAKDNGYSQALHFEYSV